MRILIVDDSKAMRMIVRRSLRQAGYGEHAVDEAANGTEALASVQASPPDLVLTDWNMPEMTGIDLVKALATRDVPVRAGMVTSQATDAMRELAREAGALFLLAKPFTPEGLRKALVPVLGE